MDWRINSDIVKWRDFSVRLGKQTTHVYFNKPKCEYDTEEMSTWNILEYATTLINADALKGFPFEINTKVMSL